MNTTTTCRCTECNAEFVPDPRVRDRQVTCGAAECQRFRHARQCRRWHATNRGVTANHYQDVVVPFRRSQPDYQKRWRWGRRLREIREKTALLGGALLVGFRALMREAERLLEGATSVIQTGVLAGERLKRAARAVRSTITAVEQLQASTAELRDLGL